MLYLNGYEHLEGLFDREDEIHCLLNLGWTSFAAQLVRLSVVRIRAGWT